MDSNCIRRARKSKHDLWQNPRGYVTKGGATREAAELIAKTLREKSGLAVDVVDLKKQKHPDIADYDNVVVGGGVRMGEVYGEAGAFLRQDLGGKRVAVFICASGAGDAKDKQKYVEKYIAQDIAKNAKPLSVEAFGGCIKILGKSFGTPETP